MPASSLWMMRGQTPHRDSKTISRRTLCGGLVLVGGLKIELQRAHYWSRTGASSYLQQTRREANRVAYSSRLIEVQTYSSMCGH